MASLPVVSIASSENTAEDEAYTDPADYIFKHKEYHDCIFTVGRNDDKVEKISAMSCDLKSHSSVFRKILTGNPAEVRIKDVSPEVFKLILTYVYGGEMPTLDQPTAAQLALAAGLYKILPLVDWACELILPECADDVFPALVCVANMSCPELEPHVAEIVQQETQAVLSSEQFLDLDAKCLEYISRQETLSVSELELWRALVLWGQHKVITEPGKTLREHLKTTLSNVRLTTLSLEEISKELIPTKILAPEEVVGLLSAVTSNRPCKLPGICNNRETRELCSSVGNRRSRRLADETVFNESYTFDCLNVVWYSDVYPGKLEELPEYSEISNLTINTHDKKLKIETFTVQSKPILKLGKQPVYKLSCTITVSKIEDGFCTETRIAQMGGEIVGGKEITFPLKLRNGQPLILDANSSYNIALDFDSSHPVHQIYNTAYSKYDTHTILNFNHISVQYDTPLHVQKIHFRA
uniref:BTB domain-containing protein n=1 Tax=Graphocephala atropunctata TaxID=36148 RepID=A0A1B6KKG8_9HEMI